MAISTNETLRALQVDVGPIGARAMQEWLEQQYDALAALTAKIDVLTAKLNADVGITDTDYAEDFASTLATYLTE